MIEKIRGRIEESIQVKQTLLAKCLPQIEKAGDALVNAYKRGKKAVWFGNGGSAADAQHIAAELVGITANDAGPFFPWPCIPTPPP